MLENVLPKVRLARSGISDIAPMATRMAQFEGSHEQLPNGRCGGVGVHTDRNGASSHSERRHGAARSHDLRHVAASGMIAPNVSIPAVQAVLGHSSPSATQEVHTHWWPGDEHRTCAAIEPASTGWPTATYDE